ncbi:hypothetical protein [Pontibacter akesuensis]|uniref:DUF3037 domain-containing protein n=1 Tax=Pontibacter akesuensis TaxID=388950 RepID=A0A1I7KSC4_9BACT|nr:hypothetical protein [Pontibacter akesuensis]GHA80984.1 hypothetical protein GCM10007389_39410 [Pontibacter akesuensis]SFV00317.1 hypothetical protein SAMN04487941_4039 [Pontibacter akesuensis]
MKTFFSIISVQTNSFSNENIVVGIIAISSNKIHFAYSKNKLSLVDKLSSAKIGSFAKSILNQIHNRVLDANLELSSNQSKLEFKNLVFSEEYFKYLNKYNNGVLAFSEPVQINLEFNSDYFSNYYKSFVGEDLAVETFETKKSFYKKLKPYFEKENLKEKADIKFVFDPLCFKGILKETQIPLITKNGKISSLQTIDFDINTNTIANHIYETQIIYEALYDFSKKVNLKLDKIKIAYEEPELESEQHKLFDLAVKEYKDVFEFVTLDEVNVYTDKICNSKNTKFSELIKEL